MNRPTFVLEKKRLEENLAHFNYLASETGIIWLYTLKAFHEREGLALIASTFDGFSLGNSKEYNTIKNIPHKMLHSYAPAFYEEDVDTLAQQSTTMSFNSLTQWKCHAPISKKHTSLGLRINPHLTLTQPSYCDSNTMRFGVDYRLFLAQYQDLEGLEGLHFHAFCHQGVSALKKLLQHIEKHYQHILPSLKWLNFGGGQNFTAKTYDTQGFIRHIQNFRTKYPHLTLYFEPGSAVVHTVGYLRCTILDILPTSPPCVILNLSTETHLLDVAITKQSPKIRDSTEIATPYHYQLSGMSCIAGDVLGKYYFHDALKIGQTLIVEDMIGYTLSKQTQFNGLKEAGFTVL